MTSWSRVVCAGLLVALASVACMREVEDVEDLPSGPSTPESPVAAPSLTPIAPVPVGPAPAPTPGPTAPGDPPPPQATPAPPTASGCRLPRGTGTGECPRTRPLFLGDVQAAIEQLVKEQPSIFVKRGCEGCYDVTDPDAYLRGVVSQMGRRGFCAMWDGEELAVKNTNDFNEQYDILSAANAVRSGGESYRSTCTPAWF
jgi:hypothetical protein